MSAEYFLRPVTVHSIVPPCSKNSEHTCNSFRGKCPMIVPISQSHHMIGSVFRHSFAHHASPTHRLPYTLLCVSGTSNTTIAFEKLFHSSYSLHTFFLISHLLWHMHVPRERRLRNNYGHCTHP